MGMHYLTLMSSEVFKGNITYPNAFSEMPSAAGHTAGPTDGQVTAGQRKRSDASLCIYNYQLFCFPERLTKPPSQTLAPNVSAMATHKEF